MKIGIIGAKGNIGSRILDEALSRGHQATAFTRNLDRELQSCNSVTWKEIGLPAEYKKGVLA